MHQEPHQAGPRPLIKVGLAISDAGFSSPAPLVLPEDLEHFLRIAADRLPGRGLFFEFQPEMPWIVKDSGSRFAPDTGNKWFELGRAVRRNDLHGPYGPAVEAIGQPENIFGVHQSIQHMDVLSEDIGMRLKTIESTKQAMFFAGQIRADYFVFHLAQSVDYWDWDRREQMEIALRAFEELADYYYQCSPDFVPLLENLEFPKFPATAAEIAILFRRCKAFFPDLRLCLDVPHLWHSRKLVLEHNQRFFRTIPDFSRLNDPFVSYLGFALQHIFRQAGEEIFLYHMGGCYGHKTHEIPGLLPGKNPFKHRLRLGERDVYNKEMEMNYPGVASTILEHHFQRERRLLMVLEIHNRSIEEMLESCRLIHLDLHKKAAALT